MTELTAILVDDDAFTRVLLTRTIEALGLKVLGAFAPAREATNFAAKGKPQLAILDLDLGPGPTGIDLAQSLRNHDPLIGLILLTSYDDPRLIRAKNLTLPEGTVYLSKRQVESDSVIQMAIASAMLQSTMDVEPLGQRPATSSAMAVKLSDSQIEVMRLVSTGLTNAEIAKQRFSNRGRRGQSHCSRLL